MKILHSLEKSPIVKEYEVLDFKLFGGGFYVKIRAEIKDGSLLFIREYVDARERNYSYHWQAPAGEMIMCWDNAPHHSGLKIFPYHKHSGEAVSENFETTCEDILKRMEEILG